MNGSDTSEWSTCEICFRISGKSSLVVFQSGCNISHFHPQYMRFPDTPPHRQTLILSVFWILALIVSVDSRDFNFHFSNYYWCWAYFPMFIGWLHSFFGSVLMLSLFLSQDLSYWVVKVPCMFWIKRKGLSQIYVVQTFSPSLYLS